MSGFENELALAEEQGLPLLLQGLVAPWPACRLWNPPEGLKYLSKKAGGSLVQVTGFDFILWTPLWLCFVYCRWCNPNLMCSMATFIGIVQWTWGTMRWWSHPRMHSTFQVASFRSACCTDSPNSLKRQTIPWLVILVHTCILLNSH